MDQKALNGLIKIGQKDHIIDLQKNGCLFCNTIKYFRGVEKKDFNRHDNREGAFKTEVVENAENYTLSINGEKVPAKLTFLRFNEFDLDKKISNYFVFLV